MYERASEIIGVLLETSPGRIISRVYTLRARGERRLFNLLAYFSEYGYVLCDILNGELHNTIN